MPPVGGSDLMSEIKTKIKDNKVVIFSKTTCPFCTKVASVSTTFGLFIFLKLYIVIFDDDVFFVFYGWVEL